MHKLRVDTPETGGLRFHAQFPVIVCAEPRFGQGDIIPVEGEQAHYWAGALEIKGNHLSVQAVDDHGRSMMLWKKRKQRKNAHGLSWALNRSARKGIGACLPFCVNTHHGA